MFQPDYEELIQVVQEFDPQLKFVTFTVHRDLEDEDVNNNIHPPPPQRGEVLSCPAFVSSLSEGQTANIILKRNPIKN